jgi:hypothetical protein
VRQGTHRAAFPGAAKPLAASISCPSHGSSQRASRRRSLKQTDTQLTSPRERAILSPGDKDSAISRRDEEGLHFQFSLTGGAGTRCPTGRLGPGFVALGLGGLAGSGSSRFNWFAVDRSSPDRVTYTPCSWAASLFWRSSGADRTLRQAARSSRLQQASPPPPPSIRPALCR